MQRGRKATTVTSRTTNCYTCQRLPSHTPLYQRFWIWWACPWSEARCGFLPLLLLGCGHTGPSTDSCCPTSAGSSCNPTPFLSSCFTEIKTILHHFQLPSSLPHNFSLFASVLSSHLQDVGLLPMANPPLMSCLSSRSSRLQTHARFSSIN